MNASRRNPAKDQIAIVGMGTTPYVRSASERSAASLAAEASRAAISDAGIDRGEIDGLFGSVVPTKQLQAALGIPAVTFWAEFYAPFGFHVVDAMGAIMSGACTTALLYNATYRGPNASRSAAADPFRRRNSNLDSHRGDSRPEDANGPYGYAAWAARYLHDYGVSREVFGRMVINSRTNAALNPHAVYRDPITMDDYLASRMIREPLSLLDMDVPVDGGDAVVLTTLERARDLCDDPILIHVGVCGRTGHGFADQIESYTQTGQQIVVDNVWAKSDLTRQDMDLFFAYDGFSNIAVSWVEAFGYCAPGEAADYLAQCWDENEARLRLDGRVLVNTHGGSLSEGGTQGSGHLREAIDQLRGNAGERQVADVRNVLIGSGGFMWNPAGLIIRKAN